MPLAYVRLSRVGRQDQVMRLPRMTTRRWMIVVAALACTLASCRLAVRLKRYRDEFFAQAANHVEAENYYRRLVSRSGSSFIQKEVPIGESTPLTEGSTAIDTTGERWIALIESDSSQQEQDARDRFKEAQARSRAIADTRDQLTAEHRARELELHRRLADYHAALARKYAAAAARPWLSIVPDPPAPR
jgi:hypothetical protein